MAECDACGKEFDYTGEKVRLYSSKLLERVISDKKLATAKVSSSYGQFKAVEVTVCRRHRWELFIQRLMPGLISFLILYLPIVFIISRFYRFEGVMLRWLYGVSAVITLGLVVVIVRTISLDAIIATILTTRSRQNGENIEYLTSRKFERLTHAGESSGILGYLSRFSVRSKTAATLPQKKSSKRETQGSKKSRR